MGLDTYRTKRNFKRTTEPVGKTHQATATGRFVVQKHAASHLHYDFRLELDGVLLSWAVPKGPSLDPVEKRLAMQVEDHPVEYGDFEGTIPPGEYGGGTVMLWDEGTWHPDGDARAGYAKGHLRFSLQGARLEGAWSLLRTSGSKFGGKDGKQAWLLIKSKDAYAQPDSAIVDDATDSVRTGRTMQQISESSSRGSRSARAPVQEAQRRGPAPSSPAQRAAARKTAGTKAAFPSHMSPMLATLVVKAPAGDDWVHEIKYDGYRMLGRIAKGKCTLFSRSGKDWTATFSALASELARLKLRDAWIDGEVVVLDPQGRSRFQKLQAALAAPKAADFNYFAFDLPYLDGHDLRSLPLRERKARLRDVIGGGAGNIRIGPEVIGQGPDFFRQSCSLSLEGAICKRLDSVYADGTRTRDRLKVKCVRRQEMVIGGFTPPQGARREFGALLLGVHDAAGLRYAGKVGTGFDDADLAAIGKLLRARARATSPFLDPPRGAEVHGARWVRPDLVAEVAFTEWSEAGALRHPSFKGLRTDKKAAEVVRESEEPSSPVTIAKPRGSAPPASRRKAAGTVLTVVAGIALTHADKLYFPEAGLSKQDLAQYYADMAPALLPYLSGRPLSLVRCPDGWSGQCFYQKNAAEHLADAVRRIDVTTSAGSATYMGVDSAPALVALVQWSVIEIHPWGSRLPRLGSCDTLVFDFDPDEGVGWPELVEGVLLLRTLLDEFKLQGFLKSTGGKGLHVVVPVRPALPWPRAKSFAKAVATLLARTFPQRFTATLAKERRKGKIFIDYLRNAEGATAIGPWSVRARRNAPVATPIDWIELDADVRFDFFNLHNVRDRLQRRTDPWADYIKLRQAVTPAMARRVELKWSEGD
ncbi:MAG: DNA ligase D [Casimicrobiaceae bacterium]